MTTSPEERSQRIAELEQSLALAGLPPGIRREFEQELERLRAGGARRAPSPDASQHHGDTVQGDKHSVDTAGGEYAEGNIDTRQGVFITGTVYGPAIGINLGTIIYGRDPDEDERRRLQWYLQTLAGKLSRLPLRGI